MPPNIKTIFVCTNCDAQFPKWNGRCSECGSWGTLREGIADSRGEQKRKLKTIAGAEIIDLQKIKATSLIRIRTGLEEIDRVLGGGLVPGSLILLSGEPGIGKSTLVAQLATAVGNKHPVIYVSGEESAQQIRTRFERLNCRLDNVKFIGETNIEKIISTVSQSKPDILIIDSIQTVYSSAIPTEAGNISQIRAATVKFLELAKSEDIAIILVGHITKDGQIAGPKSLEHIVDTVLHLEIETSNNYCLLRATKNRFGSVNELGVLEMTGHGFKEIKNPNLIFIESGGENVPGSVISCIIEGTKPFLINLQALVTKTIFGYPQRKTSGFDLNRLQVLSAVISKRTKINLINQDIILNVVGGLKINDHGLDLAACAAIISSQLNKSLDKHTLVLGEVGLGGEVRNVFKLKQRLQEAERLGFLTAIVPQVDVRLKKNNLVKIKNLEELVEIIK